MAIISDINKIQDNLISIAKCQDDVAVVPLVGGEIEQSKLGISEFAIVETGFSKVNSGFTAKKARIIASLKSSTGNQVFLKIYVDNEIIARLILNSSSLTYELVNGEFSINDLLVGKHKFTAKIYASDSSTIVWNDFIEFYLVK